MRTGATCSADRPCCAANSIAAVGQHKALCQQNTRILQGYSAAFTGVAAALQPGEGEAHKQRSY